MPKNFMTVEDAAEILMDLANETLTRIESDGSESIVERDKKQLAIDPLEDFFVNNVWDD